MTGNYYPNIQAKYKSKKMTAIPKRWAENLRVACNQNDIPFFYKQSSGQFPGTDPYLNGKKHFNFPAGIAPLKYRDTVEPEPVAIQLEMFD